MLTELPTRDPTRWVRGHHLFFSLCQGLILSTSVARRDINAKRFDAASQAIEKAITILGGVAAAFRYSADIDQLVYGNVLEPSMSERKGFSGLWSTDHAEFLRQHGLLQQAMTEMPPKYTSLIRRYEHAISAVWMSHSDVCRHIAGQRASINAQQASKPEAHLPGHLDLKHYYRPKALHGPKEAGKYEEAAKAGTPRCPLGHADSEVKTTSHPNSQIGHSMNTLTSRVSSAVFELCPDFHRGLLLVEGQIQPVVPELAELLKATIAGRRGDPIELLQDPRVLGWSEVHRKFGSNPAKYPPAHISLLKRVQNGNTVPPINNAVTIMTIISLKHVAPCGGDDVSGVEVAELRLADGGEAFIPLGSFGAPEAANKNEVIYYARPTNVTMCRRFCWRNSHLSRICDSTKRILMNFDMLGHDAASRAEGARDEAAELFERYCGSKTQRAMLSRVHSEHAFIGGSGYVH